jgi:hypothetical protein
MMTTRSQVMTVEKRQSKLHANNEARERWLRRLFRAVTELKKLEQERKRLLGPKKPQEVKYRSLDDIRMAAGGNDFHSDDIPI